MFNEAEIAEVMADEIGETRTGQNRSMVTALEDEGSRVSRVLYLRRTYPGRDTTYRDINVGETVVSVKYNSAGHQVNNAYTY